MTIKQQGPSLYLSLSRPSSIATQSLKFYWLDVDHILDSVYLKNPVFAMIILLLCCFHYHQQGLMNIDGSTEHVEAPAVLLQYQQTQPFASLERLPPCDCEMYWIPCAVTALGICSIHKLVFQVLVADSASSV